jgi:hypothetical protein
MKNYENHKLMEFKSKNYVGIGNKVMNTLTLENHHISNGQEIVELLQKGCMFGL